MKKLFSAGLILGSVLVNGFAASAATYVTSAVEIPFEFKVKNQTLPAGHYHLQDGALDTTAFLINDDTGRRVQVLRPTSTATPGKARLIFKQRGDDHVLKTIY